MLEIVIDWFKMHELQSKVDTMNYFMLFNICMLWYYMVVYGFWDDFNDTLSKGFYNGYGVLIEMVSNDHLLPHSWTYSFISWSLSPNALPTKLLN